MTSDTQKTQTTDLNPKLSVRSLRSSSPQPTGRDNCEKKDETRNEQSHMRLTGDIQRRCPTVTGSTRPGGISHLPKLHHEKAAKNHAEVPANVCVRRELTFEPFCIRHINMFETEMEIDICSVYGLHAQKRTQTRANSHKIVGR